MNTFVNAVMFDLVDTFLCGISSQLLLSVIAFIQSLLYSQIVEKGGSSVMKLCNLSRCEDRLMLRIAYANCCAFRYLFLEYYRFSKMMSSFEFVS